MLLVLGQLPSRVVEQMEMIEWKMSLVVDTNVVIAGLRARRGASFEIVSAMLQKRINFLISVPLLLEYEEVMKRVDPDLLPFIASSNQ